MANPQVTITLGRSGQKVVKESWGDSNGGYANGSVAPGSKRSFTESYGSSVDRSFRYNKRMREDSSMRSYGNNRHMDESHIGPKDLRLKLMRNRVSRRKQLENDKCKTMELHEKVSRAIKSLESPHHHRRLLPNGLLSRAAANSPKLDSVKGYSASWNSSTVRSRFTYHLPRSTGGFLHHRRSIDELRQGPQMRSVDTSRSGTVFDGDPLYSTRPKVPMPATSRRPLNYHNPVTALAPATGGISISPHPDSQPHTVYSLLHSLGLAKYSINFRAEEIDMVALKQMGDGDLKELGIPMGPRKKILLGLQAQTKRTTHADRHSSYVS